MKKYIIDPIVYSDIDCEKHQLNCMTLTDGQKQLQVWLENNRIDTDLSNPARFPIPH